MSAHLAIIFGAHPWCMVLPNFFNHLPQLCAPMNLRRIDPAKNLRCLFYLRGWLRLLLPDPGRLKHLRQRYRLTTPGERLEIQTRGDYYLKSDVPFDLARSEAEMTLAGYRSDPVHRRKSSYFHDLYEHLRFYPDVVRFAYRFGDNYSTPEVPTFVKARSLTKDSSNAVLMKLNKVRHYVFADDAIDFGDKLDRLVWRGNAKREHRREFVRRFHRHPFCDVGQTNDCGDTAVHRKPFMKIEDQLRYKFILSIEGNDVATNLKWIFSSQSVCFMTRPTRESWFMEGSLVPDHHYVLLRDDYSDFDEKLRFYLARPEKCREIIRNANAHVARFQNEDIEALVSLYVIDKYLALSGQRGGLGFFEAGEFVPAEERGVPAQAEIRHRFA